MVPGAGGELGETGEFPLAVALSESLSDRVEDGTGTQETSGAEIFEDEEARVDDRSEALLTTGAALTRGLANVP